MGKVNRQRNPVPFRSVTPPPAGAWPDNSYVVPDYMEQVINTDKKIGHRAEYKRIISEFDPKTRKWSNSEQEEESESEDEEDSVINELDEFCFVFRKRIKPQEGDLPPVITEFIDIKSHHIRRACLEVIGNKSGISWNASYLDVKAEQVLGYYPEFKEYLARAEEWRKTGETPSNPDAAEEDSDVNMMIAHVKLFLAFLQSEYKDMLAEVEDLRKSREITHEYLWSLFKPDNLYVTKSIFTGAPIVVRLLSPWNHNPFDCEALEATEGGNLIWERQTVTLSTSFFGRVPTTQLNIYPLEDHPNVEEFKDNLIARGKRWKGLTGMHLKQYTGAAFLPGGRSISIRDRVMIDRKAYSSHGTATSVTHPWGNNSDAPNNHGWKTPNPYAVTGGNYQTSITLNEATDDDLLLAPAHVYGFSFKDKQWFTLQVGLLQPVNWDPLAFEQLSMEMERKALLQSLVEFHDKGAAFQDIVARKGRGLVLNLFGPPGTGKTLTAEAISEYVRKPLYSLTAGDLGSSASDLSTNLTRIFNLCARWNAIILLDEADIFLEARSTHEIKRNAMVSVFLKELEYFEGIIFLTTNRIETFDRAFQSRIHVSLRYDPLSFRSRREVWVSLLQRSGFSKDKSPLTKQELDKLATTPKNGREIRNIVRTAEAVATSRKETLGFRHLLQVKDISNEFEVAQAANVSQIQNGKSQMQHQSLIRKILDDGREGQAFALIFVLIIVLGAFLGFTAILADAYKAGKASV